MQPPRVPPRRLLAFLARLRPAAFAGALSSVVLLVGGLLVARGRIPFTSDQALPALMAQDILDGTARPVFYYGVEYGGALEPWLLAGVFRAVGPSSQAYRATMALFLVAAVLGLWATGLAAGGRRTGAAVGVCALLGPVYFYYKMLTSDGAYAALTVAGIASLLALVVGAERLGKGRPAGGPLAALGLSLGVAFWVHLASVPYLVVGALVCGSWVVRRRVSPPAALLVAAGFAAGSLPWWVRNVETGFRSLRLPEASPVGAGTMLSRLGRLAEESLPTLLGPSSFRGPATPVWAKVLVVATVAGLVVAGLRRALRPEPSGTRFLCRLALSLAASSLAAFLVPRSASPWEPRYLLPALVGLVLLAGVQLAAALRRPDARLVLAAAPACLAVASHVRAPYLRDFQRVTSDDPGDRSVLYARAGKVLSALSGRGVRAIYGSYWTVYRLAFLSSRGIAGAPLGRVAVDRMPAMTRRVAADPAPAFVLEGADLRDLESYLARRGVVAELTRVEGLVVVTGVPERELAEIRSVGGIPPA